MQQGVCEQGRTLSYAQLEGRANQLARYLQRQGVQPGSCVGLLMERSINLMVAMLATLKAGAAYVPMDPEYPPDRLALMAQDSEVSYEGQSWPQWPASCDPLVSCKLLTCCWEAACCSVPWILLLCVERASCMAGYRAGTCMDALGSAL